MDDTFIIPKVLETNQLNHLKKFATYFKLGGLLHLKQKLNSQINSNPEFESRNRNPINCRTYYDL